MKRYTLALFVMFLSCRTYATEPLILGILEEPQCKEGTPRSVRPLFAKKDTRWVALISKETVSSFNMERIEWTAAFDGKDLGQLVSIDPQIKIYADWTYPRDHLLTLEPGQKLPQISNKAKAFSGWCVEPQYFPIVLVSAPNFKDPEQWKPASSSIVDKHQLLAAFRKATNNAELCEDKENEKLKPFKYSESDLRVTNVFKSIHNRQLIAVDLSKTYTPCNAPSWPEQPKWFLLDKTLRYLGNNLSLIDTGDYDNDGKSEIVFWYSGYNRDGYVLFYNDLRERVDFIWGYH